MSAHAENFGNDLLRQVEAITLAVCQAYGASTVSLDELPTIVAALVTDRQRLEATIREAMALLKPVAREETLSGAIRNLQQAYLTTCGNLETAEQLLTAVREKAEYLCAFGPPTPDTRYVLDEIISLLPEGKRT